MPPFFYFGLENGLLCTKLHTFVMLSEEHSAKSNRKGICQIKFSKKDSAIFIKITVPFIFYTQFLPYICIAL